MFGVSPNRDYISVFEYISPNTFKKSTIDKMPLNRDCRKGSILNGVRRPKLNSFVLDKLFGFSIDSKPEKKTL